MMTPEELADEKAAERAADADRDRRQFEREESRLAANLDRSQPDQK